MSRPSPPKPFELRRMNTSSSLPTSTASSAAAIPTTNPTTTSSPSVPPRPLSTSSTALSTPNRPWDVRNGSSPYDRYGSSTYGSSYGSGYGSNYGSGYGSSYGSPYSSTYGSRYGGYGSYGSGYGSGYGSSYHGSSYGGYGGYGYGSSLGYGNYGSRYGGYGGPMQDGMRRDSAWHGFVDSGRNLVDGFSHFSRLLDANFDAMHGSFASVLRLLDVAGEFFYVVKTFAIVRLFAEPVSKIGRLVSWLLFGGAGTLRLDGTKGGAIDYNDFLKKQKGNKRRMLPMLLLLSFFSAPVIFLQLFRMMRDRRVHMIEDGQPQQQLENGNQPQSLESAWGSESQPTPSPVDPNATIVQAVADFSGSSPMELSLRKDDTVVVLNKPYPEWWEGRTVPDGRVGLFPVTFVRGLSTNPDDARDLLNKPPV